MKQTEDDPRCWCGHVKSDHGVDGDDACLGHVMDSPVCLCDKFRKSRKGHDPKGVWIR